MKLKKDITFIYMDSAEKSNFIPIYEEAKKRGYNVKMTTNKFEKCEIGFYCQHVNFPQYSKFSIIMLHDIVQQNGNWPDIWLREPWNKYNVGILPSNQWIENWNACSQWYYTRPKDGIYLVGWPKADTINKLKENTYKDEFYKKYNLDPNKKTVLYAPAWENDNKQDDFVKSMLSLDVNILIKQYDADPALFPENAYEINRMYELHKNMSEVTILPQKTNIFEAIAVSDILVSEESSTMAEAIMMGIPAISVSNWLIPDVTPKRLPECSYDFVISTTKEELSNCVNEIINNYEKYKDEAISASKNNFSNIGNSATMIMDIIDDFVNENNVRYSSLIPNNYKRVPVKKYIYHLYIITIREVYDNYRERYTIIRILWNCLSKIKHLFFG